MTQIASKNSIPIEKTLKSISSQDEKYDIELSDGNGTVFEAVNSFLDSSKIIPKAKQTTDINNRKNNSITQDNASILAVEAITFVLDDKGTVDTNKLITTMNYMCANLDEASIALFLSEMADTLKTLNNSLEDDQKIDISAIKAYLTDENPPKSNNGFGHINGDLTPDNVYGAYKDDYVLLFDDIEINDEGTAESKQALTKIMIDDGVDFSDYKKMASYESNNKHRSGHIRDFIANNGLFSGEDNNQDLQKLVIGIIEQCMNTKDVNPAELLGLYIKETSSILMTEMGLTNLFHQIPLQFGRYIKAFFPEADQAFFDTVADMIAPMRNDDKKDKEIFDQFQIGISHSTELTDKNNGNGEIVIGKADVTKNRSVNDFLNSTGVIPTDNQTTDIYNRQRNMLEPFQTKILAEETIEYSISNGKADINTLITTMNYISANLDEDSITLFMAHIGNILGKKNDTLSEGNKFDIDTITAYFLGIDKAPTSDNGFGQLTNDLTADNVYGTKAILYGALIANPSDIDGIEDGISQKNESIQTAIEKTTAINVYDALEIVDENNNNSKGVSSETLKEFVLKKLQAENPDLTQQEIENFNLLLGGLVPLSDTLYDSKTVKNILAEIENFLFFPQDIWTDVKVATKITLDDGTDFSDYTKMPEYNSNGGNRNQHIRDFIDNNGLFKEGSTAEQKNLDVQKLVVGILEQCGTAENANPAELLGNYIKSVVDILCKEKGMTDLNTQIFLQFGRYAGAYNQNNDSAFFSTVIDVADIDKNATNEEQFKIGLERSTELIGGENPKVEYFGSQGIFDPTDIDYADPLSRSEKRKQRWNITKKIAKSLFIGDSPAEIALNIGLLVAGVFSGGATIALKIGASIAKVAKIATGATKIAKTTDKIATSVGISRDIYDVGKSLTNYAKTGDKMELIGMVGLFGLAGIPLGKARESVTNTKGVDDTPAPPAKSDADANISDDATVKVSNKEKDNPVQTSEQSRSTNEDDTLSVNSEITTDTSTSTFDTTDDIIQKGSKEQKLTLIQEDYGNTLTPEHIDDLLKTGDDEILSVLVKNNDIKLSKDHIYDILLKDPKNDVLIGLVNSGRELSKDQKSYLKVSATSDETLQKALIEKGLAKADEFTEPTKILDNLQNGVSSIISMMGRGLQASGKFITDNIKILRDGLQKSNISAQDVNQADGLLDELRNASKAGASGDALKAVYSKVKDFFEGLSKGKKADDSNDNLNEISSQQWSQWIDEQDNKITDERYKNAVKEFDAMKQSEWEKIFDKKPNPHVENQEKPDWLKDSGNPFRTTDDITPPLLPKTVPNNKPSVFDKYFDIDKQLQLENYTINTVPNLNNTDAYSTDWLKFDAVESTYIKNIGTPLTSELPIFMRSSTEKLKLRFQRSMYNLKRGNKSEMLNQNNNLLDDSEIV